MRAISREAYARLELRHDRHGVRQRDGRPRRSATSCGSRERDIVYHPRVGESKLESFRDGWRHLRFMMLHSPTSIAAPARAPRLGARLGDACFRWCSAR